MKKTLLALLCAVIFIVFLIASAPAGLAASILRRTTPIQLEGVSGTFWHGTAQRVVTPELQLGQVTWRIHGWRLLRGVAELTLEFPAGTDNLRGRAELGFNLLGKLSLRDVDLQADADWVFARAAIPIAAGGFFSLQIDSAEFQQDRPPRLKAQLDWQEAEVIYPQRYGLGAYRLSLQHAPEIDPQYILGEVHDIDSPFNINGTVRIESNGDYRFTARIDTDPAAPEILRHTLLFIGAPDADGSVPIERTGNLFNEF
ncbi:MAG TPA: type II secretion system protein N [Gammaproteobacteria bacterium]